MKAIFTRYLYFKEEVIDTLIWAILDKSADESLFWAYELYFSGFQYEVFETLDLLYETLFKEKNPDIGIYLNYLIKEWDDTQDKHYILGNIVNVLLNKKVSTTAILRDIIDNGSANEIETNTMYPEGLSEKDIMKYYTITSVDVDPRKILDKACKYNIRKQTCNDLGLIGFDFKKKHCDNWLYYANQTPIWNERILEFQGKSDKLTRTIIFDDEDNEESFYEKYGLDPDEQSIFLKNRIWSSEISVNISLAEFNTKYGQYSVFRTVRIHKDKYDIINLFPNINTTGEE